MSKFNSGASTGVVPPFNPGLAGLKDMLNQRGVPESALPQEAPQGGVPPMGESPYGAPPPEYTDYQGPENDVAPEEPTPVDMRQPMDVGWDQLSMMDRNGVDVPQEKALVAQEIERRRQAAYASGVPLQWETERELGEAFKNTNASHRGTIVLASLDLGTQLARSQVERVSSEPGMPSTRASTMTYLQQALNRSPTEVANLANTTMALMSPVISGSAETDGAGMITDPDIAEMAMWASDGVPEAEGPAPVLRRVDGGMPLDSYAGMAGSLLMKTHQMGNVDSAGNALPPKPTTIGAREAGYMFAQAQVDAGYAILDKTSGETVIRMHPDKGAKYYTASRAMSRDITDMSRGRSQVVPVTTKGEYVGGAATYRQGDKVRAQSGKVQEPEEAIRIHGSVALVTSPIKAFFAALLVNQAVNEAIPGMTQNNSLHSTTSKHPKDHVGKPIEGMASTLALVGITPGDLSADKGMVVKTKATVLTKLAKYFGLNLKDNTPRYAKHWIDRVVWRLYNDSEDANLQRDLLSRGTYVGMATPMSVAGTTWHQSPPSKALGKEIMRGIAAKIEKKDMSLTTKEREFAWLATVGHALDVAETLKRRDGSRREQGSMLPYEVPALMTPQFLQQAAYIGRVLASIAPSSTAALTGMVSDMTTLNVQLDPTQMAVLNNFITSSTKKNWGYRLQAYMDIAQYMNAASKGIAFTPRATTEIDMSSAGKTFTSGDTGDRRILSRTGILYKDNGEAFTDTLPEGNPRSLFMDIALKEGIDKAFSRDNSERAEAVRKILSENTSTEFKDSFGKSPIMITGYGMPAMYQYGSVRAFLKKQPGVEAALLPFYNNDRKALISDLNQIYKNTLTTMNDNWHSEVPKDLCSLLGMFGKVPTPIGAFGEKMSIGSFVATPTGEETIIRSASGETHRVPRTKNVLNPNAPAKPKMIVNEDYDPEQEASETNAPHIHFVPKAGTAVRNAVGPILGQYRESLLNIWTALHLNGGKKPNEMLFMQTVHDNSILNSGSFLQAWHTANNIMLPKVYEWNIAEAFVKDAAQQVKHFMTDTLPKMKGPVYIGPNSEFHGTLVAMDRLYERALNKEKGGKWMTPYEKNTLKFLESPSSGYRVPTETRPEGWEITPKQLEGLVKHYMLSTMYQPGKDGKLDGVYMPFVWADKTTKLAFKKEIDRNAREMRNNFYI